MAALNHALDRYIDFGSAARSAVGGYWGRMQPEGHTRLIHTLRDHIAKRLSLFLFDGAAHPIVVGDPADVVVRDSSDRAMVPARLRLAPGNSLPLGFLMADRSAGRPRIVDVIIGGVSLMGMLADECRAVVARDGVDGLMARLSQ